jgi:hypothetical protein
VGDEGAAVQPTSLELQIFSLPLWLIGLLTLGGLALAVAAGRALNRAWQRRFGADEPDRPSQNFILSASLGLLSLLLAFTFSMASDNFDRRRALVIEESGAIAGVYMLAQSFDEPHRSRISAYLRAYVGNRLLLGRSRDMQSRMQLLRQSETLQAHIWAASLAAARSSENPVEAIFLNTTQQAINTGTARDATRWGHHIPARVSAFLVVYMLVTAVLLGFQTPTTKPLVMGATLLLLLTLSTVLILDLDGPTQGAIIEMQQPMQRLHDRMARGTPDALNGLAAELDAGR